MLKLNLGCGHDIREGFINCDLYNDKAEMKFDSIKLPFDDNSVDEIMAYHVIEHFPYNKIWKALGEWNRALKHGGRLHLETPDFLSSCEAFVKADYEQRRVLHGHFFSEGGDSPGQLHYFLFTEYHLFWMLDASKFHSFKRLEPDSSYVTGPPYVDKKLMLNVEAFK